MSKGTRKTSKKLSVIIDLLYDEIQLRQYARSHRLSAEDRMALVILMDLLIEERRSLK